MNDDPLWPMEKLIPAALAAGALSASDVVLHGVCVEQVGRSHPVYRFLVGGQRLFYAKLFGVRRGQTDGLPEREWAVQDLGKERPAVASLIAPNWPWKAVKTPGDEIRVVATRSVVGQEAWLMEGDATGTAEASRAWHDLVAALAGPLAKFHLENRDLARPGASVPESLLDVCPWGLAVMDGDAAQELWSMPNTGVLLREAASDVRFVAELRAARALWRPMTLIHADLKHDNVLLDRTADGCKVTVLDWEMARLGDPAWDLAGLCARLAVLRNEGPPWPAEDLNHMAALLSAYAHESGLPVAALAQRVLVYAGAVLLMTSLQHASTLVPGSDLTPARSLMNKARSTLHRSPSLVTDLLQRTRQRDALPHA